MNYFNTFEKLSHLRSLQKENEIVEFKEAKNNFDFKKIGKYFSALSNEANLMNKKEAWLVFGISDKEHQIVGTNYRNNETLQKLKKEIADKTTDRITFKEIFDITLSEGRVVLFQIPPAPKGIPISFDGHYYGRDGESLVALNIEKIERIREQINFYDWSAEIIDDADLSDLDSNAINYARERFIVKFPEFKEDVYDWSDETFLNKAKLTIKNKITRATIILLGKSESENLLIPSISKIRWILKSVDNFEKDYDIFTPPFLLAIDKIYNKIRNLKYRYLPEGTLFPNELLRYEPFNIREALNNAIAHNDYSQAGYINVVEIEDQKLIFSNNGNFIPGSVENVINNDAPEENYRNPFLANAMFQLGLVDTRGGGIKKMYKNQINRLFPLPDYDIDNNKIKVTIMGSILDIKFSEILSKNPDLTFRDVILLDKVQKNSELSDDEYSYLKSLGLIEGRKPNIYLSDKVVKSTNEPDLKAEYIQNKSFDDDYFKDMIIHYLKKFETAKRKDFDNLLIPKLSNVLTDKQKKIKVGNLLYNLRRNKMLKADSNKIWSLNDEENK